MDNIIKISNKKIGENNPVFLIAEIGSNHNRNKNTVKKLIKYCAQAGFDAVKFQIYDPEEAFSKNVTTKDVKLDHLYGLRPWWQVARDKILMPREWFKEMFNYVRSFGMIPLSAIHRSEDCKFLLKFGLPAIKIASIDLTYFQLLEKLVHFKLPMIVSTGMGTNKEIDETIKFLKKKGQKKVALLHCVSCYPPKNDEINLRNITFFKNNYNFPIGLSDHSTGIISPLVAVALGAKIIEKHITLNKRYPGPDHPFAIEPQEMIQMVKEIRNIEKALGNEKRTLSRREIQNKKMIRRSIIAKKDIIEGEKINLKKIKFARPGTGISTKLFYKVSKMKAKKKIKSETILQWNMLKK